MPGRDDDSEVWPEERETLAPCAACGGEWRTFTASGKPAPKGTSQSYSVQICRWCTNGGQTAEQRARWEAHRAKSSS